MGTGAECGENNEIKDNEVAGTMANIESVEDDEREKARQESEQGAESRHTVCVTRYMGSYAWKGLVTRRQGGTGALVRRAKCSGRVPITFIIFSHRGSAIDVTRNEACSECVTYSNICVTYML